jgi:hypothetical protein
MANGKPYADLELRLMAGNYGPDSKMSTAVAAPTPNVPWARFGCSNIVDFDGQGTSAATPQVAAAAAIWLQKNRAAVDAYQQGWMRVEAIRNALFNSAKRNEQEVKRLGRGELRASDALAVVPGAASQLSQGPRRREHRPRRRRLQLQPTPALVQAPLALPVADPSSRRLGAPLRLKLRSETFFTVDDVTLCGTSDVR